MNKITKLGGSSGETSISREVFTKFAQVQRGYVCGCSFAVRSYLGRIVHLSLKHLACVCYSQTHPALLFPAFSMQLTVLT